MPGAFERAGLKFISEIGGGSGSRFREEKARSRTKVTVRISSPAGTRLAEGTERTAAPSRAAFKCIASHGSNMRISRFEP